MHVHKKLLVELKKLKALKFYPSIAADYLLIEANIHIYVKTTIFCMLR